MVTPLPHYFPYEPLGVTSAHPVRDVVEVVSQE